MDSSAGVSVSSSCPEKLGDLTEIINLTRTARIVDRSHVFSEIVASDKAVRSSAEAPKTRL
jgi:hypothetical protein